jgi:hypothetical protein
MIRIKSEKVLLVAPNVFSVEVLSSNKQIRHVTSAANIFPAIFEMNPNLIVFDYDYLQKDIDKIIRRIRSNSYYDKLKICCYKTQANTKTDGLLKALGTDYILYREEFTKPEIKPTVNPFRNVIDSTIMNLLVTASY